MRDRTCSQQPLLHLRLALRVCALGRILDIVNVDGQQTAVALRRSLCRQNEQIVLREPRRVRADGARDRCDLQSLVLGDGCVDLVVFVDGQRPALFSSSTVVAAEAEWSRRSGVVVAVR